MSNFLPLPDGRYLKVGAGPHEGRGRQVLLPRRRAARRLRGAARAHGQRFARARARHAAQCGDGTRARRRSRRPRRRRQSRKPPALAWPRRAARPPRALHPLGRRRARPMVRERSDQGDPRLRRNRRNLRQPLCGRHGLRAAASLLGRGERQEGRLGPCDRRHGRDCAGDRARLRRAQRRDSHELRRERDSGREGPRRRRRHGQGREACGARGRLEPSSEAHLREASRSCRSARRLPRPHRLLSQRLGLVPDELRARANCRAFRPARARRRPSIMARHRDRAEPRLYGARLHGRAAVRLVGGADHRNADPLDARRLTRARRGVTSRPCSASMSRRSCRTGARGTRRARRSPIS